MATVYKIKITSHWINYPPEDMMQIIEKLLKEKLSKPNEITIELIED